MVRVTRSSSGRTAPARKPEPVEEPASASDSDDDAPVEISSKKQPVVKDSAGPDIVLAEAPERDDDGPTLYEQMRAKKAGAEAAKRVKKAERKKVARKAKGVYEVKTKQATFTVRTLGEGSSAPLKTAVSFREQLLQARTEGRREKNPEGMRQRAAFMMRSK